MIQIVVTLINLAFAVSSMVLAAIAIIRSRNIFIKAKYRDVREILSDDIEKYERDFVIKLILKWGISVLLLCFSISRISIGFIYVSSLDMWLWVVLYCLIFAISYIDFKISSPEKELNERPNKQ